MGMNGSYGLVAAVALLSLGACKNAEEGAPAGTAAGMGGAAGMAGAAAGGGRAVATITPFGMGNTLTGTATFTQTGTDVMLVVSLTNCPDGPHGVHIHEGTSCADAMTQGAHWGPTRGEGIPNVMCTGMTGTATVTRTAADAMLAWSIGGNMASNVVGHAFVVHNPAPADPPMAPAPRIGCGVITAM